MGSWGGAASSQAGVPDLMLSLGTLLTLHPPTTSTAPQVLGNHEFDAGPQLLGSFIGNLSFPMLGACNVDTSGEPALRGKLKQFVVLQQGGVKVGQRHA